MLLQQLPHNAVARIAGLNVDPEDAIKLKAMGICLGRQVQLVQAGDPLIVRVLGTRIGLSGRLATGILVELTPTA